MQLENQKEEELGLEDRARAQAGEIIGGTESKPHSRPCMAYLEIVTSQGKQAACGGFLIKKGLCADGRALCRELRQWVPFISKWELKEKASLTLAMGTLPLPSQFTFIHPGRMCWVAGWGKTDVKEPASSTLQEVELRIVEPQVCSLFPAFDHNLQLSSFLSPMGSCSESGVLPRVSGYQEGKEDTASDRDISPHEEPVFLSLMAGRCGGALLCARVAQGIVSYQQSNAKLPAVFTRISYYRPWIDEVLNEN
ncbi:mast cell protease 2-like [Dama dama]|uniref:mast cell protease 2-like n=1 Tax=Dama dama TaxID=30532 RepID=UPI002A363DB1|nr:mast cell protease 2-like [Dama dama]